MKTKGELVGVNLLMIFIVFLVILIFGGNIALYQAIVIVALLICWQILAIYALKQL